MNQQKILIATSNKGKALEIKQILSGLPFTITSLSDLRKPVPEIKETGLTFYDNAFIKADWVFDNKPGVWTLADDSGLEVDFLDGAPGVWSARYAHEYASSQENNKKLLHELKNCPKELRTARFRCVIVLRISESETWSFEGVCEGRIAFEPQGTHGFGYDPLFIPDGFDCTFAELGDEQKNRISHRGKALENLKVRLREFATK
jgi:XTP/dITP diphosphohydrolase